MKSYETITIENHAEVEADVLQELNSLLVNQEIKSIKYGLGRIIEVDSLVFRINAVSNDENLGCSIKVRFEDDNEVRTFVLTVLQKPYLFIVNQAIQNEFLALGEVLTQLRQIDEEICHEELLQKIKAWSDERQREKDEKKEKEEERTYQIRQKHIMDMFEGLKAQPKSVDSDFYVALGWLAQHAGTITANIPDYAENWFVKKFGDMPRKVIDSKKKTTGGYAMKWGPAFTVSIKKDANMPTSLAEYYNSENKCISGIEFVSNLIDNYGFVFGKVQDINAIRSTIPTDKVDSFNFGLTL